MRYIGQMWANTYEDFNGLNDGLHGATPPGGDNADYAEPRKYPAVTYHDLRFEWNVGHPGTVGLGPGDLRFYVGVDNVLEQIPPLGLPARVARRRPRAATRRSTNIAAAASMPASAPGSKVAASRRSWGRNKVPAPFFSSAGRTLTRRPDQAKVKSTGAGLICPSNACSR